MVDMRKMFHRGGNVPVRHVRHIQASKDDATIGGCGLECELDSSAGMKANPDTAGDFFEGCLLLHSSRRSGASLKQLSCQVMSLPCTFK